MIIPIHQLNYVCVCVCVRLLLIEGSVAQKWKDRIGRKVKVRRNTLNILRYTETHCKYTLNILGYSKYTLKTL